MRAICTSVVSIVYYHITISTIHKHTATSCSYAILCCSTQNNYFCFRLRTRFTLHNHTTNPILIQWSQTTLNMYRYIYASICLYEPIRSMPYTIHASDCEPSSLSPFRHVQEYMAFCVVHVNSRLSIVLAVAYSCVSCNRIKNAQICARPHKAI